MTSSIPCPDRTNLKKFLAGELPPADCQRIETHVAVCPRCLRAAGDLDARTPLGPTPGLVLAFASEAHEQQVLGPLIQRLRALDRPASFFSYIGRGLNL